MKFYRKTQLEYKFQIDNFDAKGGKTKKIACGAIYISYYLSILSCSDELQRIIACPKNQNNSFHPDLIVEFPFSPTALHTSHTKNPIAEPAIYAAAGTGGGAGDIPSRIMH